MLLGLLALWAPFHPASAKPLLSAAPAGGMAGGYSPTSVRNNDVVKAAAKAIELCNAWKIKAELKAYKAAGYPSVAAAKAANVTGMLDGLTLRILKVDKAEKQQVIAAGKQGR